MEHVTNSSDTVLQSIPTENISQLKQSPESDPVLKQFNKPKQHVWKLLVVLLLVLLMVMFGFVLSLLQQQITPQKSLSQIVTTTDLSPKNEAMIDEIAKWKTYTNYGYTIQYPEDWEVVPSTNGFSIKQELYELSFVTSRLGFGPSICIFSDSPNFNNPYTDNPILAGSKCPGNYVEINGKGNVFRRKADLTSVSNDQMIGNVPIYVKNAEGDFVTIPPISYTFPIPNVDSSTILLMDKILSTLNIINKTSNNTIEFKTYSSPLYGYSITYPSYLTTQNEAAGAGIQEAPQNARNFYIYKIGDSDPYVNRYLNVEHLGVEPSYSAKWIETPVILGGKTVKKFTDSSQVSLFDIYIVKLDTNKEYLEIYVTNISDRKDIANQILSSFTFKK